MRDRNIQPPSDSEDPHPREAVGATSGAIWSRIYKYELSPVELLEIMKNVTGFFDVLSNWDRRSKE